MASRLTYTAVNARKGIKILIVGLVLILILRVLLINAWRIIQQNLPQQEIPPTLAFDVLPPINFPRQTNELPTLTYTVETADGTYPVFDKNIKVYAFQQLYETLASNDEMVADAKVFGYVNRPQKDVFNERIYIFKASNAPSEMKYDIITKSFSISYNLANDSSPLNSRSRTPKSAEDLIKSRLKSAGLLTEDIETGRSTHNYLKVEGQNILSALALADAQLVQINLFRKNLESTETFEGYPVVTADPNKANIWFILSGTNETIKTIIAGEYKYFPIDRTLFGTYPIKTAEQALQDLVDGKGYVANLGFNVDGNVTITDINLGYYDPNVPSAFMQPIYIFEGRDNFVAYVSAVTDEYIDSNSE